MVDAASEFRYQLHIPLDQGDVLRGGPERRLHHHVVSGLSVRRLNDRQFRIAETPESAPDYVAAAPKNLHQSQITYDYLHWPYFDAS